MKLSTTLTLALAAITTASPVAIPEPASDALETHYNGKRCCLLLALFLLQAAKKPANNKPATTPCKTTTPCTTPTTTPCTTSKTTTPCTTTTGPVTKRDSTNDATAMTDLFNFIDAASEEDVASFIHFYKNADQADVQAWWNGKTVSNDTGLVPSFSVSRIHVIASSAAESAATATAVQTITVGETTTVAAT